MGPYRGYLWCELHLPSNVITRVIAISVFVWHLPNVLTWVLKRHYVCLFNTCWMYSHGCSIGTIDTMEIWNRHNGDLKFWICALGLVSMVWVFWCQNLNLYRKMHWSKRNLTGLLKNPICPYHDCFACVLIKIGVVSWNGSKTVSF